MLENLILLLVIIKIPIIVNEVTIRAVSKYLNENKVSILHCDFEESINQIKKNSFVYFDPPYHPVSNSSSFTGYNSGGFGKREQTRLRDLCDRLNKRGIKFLLSNSSTPFIQELYRNYKVTVVKANRYVNSIAEKRGEIDELLNQKL